MPLRWVWLVQTLKAKRNGVLAIRDDFSADDRECILKAEQETADLDTALETYSGFYALMRKGRALQYLQKAAIRRANANTGKKYNNVWNELGTEVPHLVATNKTTRRQLIWMFEETNRIIPLFEALAPDEQRKLNSASSIWRKWRPPPVGKRSSRPLNGKRGVMSRDQFKRILAALHPDHNKFEQATEVFQLFNEMESVLVFA